MKKEIAKMKNRKAMGEDQIPNEFMNKIGEEFKHPRNYTTNVSRPRKYQRNGIKKQSHCYTKKETK